MGAGVFKTHEDKEKMEADSKTLQTAGKQAIF